MFFKFNSYSFLGLLPSIEKLFLHENHLTKLPNELGNLKKLTELNIDENKIQNLPQTIGGCEKLEVLNSNQNRLVDLPKGMFTASFFSCTLAPTYFFHARFSFFSKNFDFYFVPCSNCF